VHARPRCRRGRAALRAERTATARKPGRDDGCSR
jgi:hypothetical protein